MIGFIEKYRGDKNVAWIKGEDGETYFTHGSEFVNTNKVHVSNIVSFDVAPEVTGEHPRAVNVKKIGLGKRHPFAQDIKRVYDFVSAFPQSEERDYRLRDLAAVQAYFENCRDFEWCRNPREVFCVRFKKDAPDE